MNSKVWVVQEYVPYEGEFLVDIFATEQAAKAFIADTFPNKPTGTYEIEEWEVHDEQ